MKPELKVNHEIKDYNLNLLDMSSYRKNMLSLSYYVPSNNIKAGSLELYIEMLKESSLTYVNKAGLSKHLLKLHNATLEMSLEYFDRDTILTFTISCIDDKYVHSIKNLRMEIIEVLVNLVKKGYGRDEKLLSLCKERILKRLEAMDLDPNQLCKASLHKQFLSRNNYGFDHKKMIENVSSLTYLDLVNTKNEILNAPIMVTYLGVPDAQTVLKIRREFKPTPYIAKMRSNELVIGTPEDIKFHRKDVEGTYAYIAYRLQACKSEQELLNAQMLLPVLLSEKGALGSLLNNNSGILSLDYDYLPLNGLLVIKARVEKSKCDMALERIKNALDQKDLYCPDDVLKRVKISLKAKYLNYTEDLDKYCEFMRLTTYLAFSRIVTTYLERIEKTDLTQLKSCFRLLALIGASVLEGRGE